MRKYISLIILAFFTVLIFSSGTIMESEYNQKLQTANGMIEKYKSENEMLSKKVLDLNNLLEEKEKVINENPFTKMKTISSLSYISLAEKESVVYVETSTELKILPYDDAPSIRNIEDNTLVTVKEKVSNTGNYDDLDTIWYRVSISVYDTPSDCIGWIKLNQTKTYTKENQKNLKQPIGVKIGAIGSESYSGQPDFDNINLNRVFDYEGIGKIVNEQGDYVQLLFAGAQEIWVSKNDLVYPKIP